MQPSTGNVDMGLLKRLIAPEMRKRKIGNTWDNGGYVTMKFLGVTQSADQARPWWFEYLRQAVQPRLVDLPGCRINYDSLIENESIAPIQ